MDSIFLSLIRCRVGEAGLRLSPVAHDADARRELCAERVMPGLANRLSETHLCEIGQQLKVSPQDVPGLLLRECECRLGRKQDRVFNGVVSAMPQR